MSELKPCPATFGGEEQSHSWVQVSRSSYRDAPYTMCSKCGAVQDHNTRTKGQDSE